MDNDEPITTRDLVIASKDVIIRALNVLNRRECTISAVKDATIAILHEQIACLRRRVSNLQNELENMPSRGETLASDGERIMVRQGLIEGKIDAFTRQPKTYGRADGDDATYLGMLTMLKQDIKEMTASVQKLLEWKGVEAGAVGKESGSLPDEGA